MCFLRFARSAEKKKLLSVTLVVFAMVHYSISTSRPCRCNLFCSFFSCLNTQCKQGQQNKVLKNFLCVSCVCVCVGGGGGARPPWPLPRIRHWWLWYKHTIAMDTHYQVVSQLLSLPQSIEVTKMHHVKTSRGKIYKCINKSSTSLLVQPCKAYQPSTQTLTCLLWEKNGCQSSKLLVSSPWLLIYLDSLQGRTMGSTKNHKSFDLAANYMRAYVINRGPDTYWACARKMATRWVRGWMWNGHECESLWAFWEESPYFSVMLGV